MKSIYNTNQITTTIIYSKKHVRIKYLNNNDKKFFDSIITLRFVETKETKKYFMLQKKTISIWNVNVDNIISLITLSYYLFTLMLMLIVLP